MSPAFLKRKKRRVKPLPPLERLEARALLSAVISVSANSRLLTPGETTPSPLDFTDFGVMSTTPDDQIGELTHTFTITNTGDQPLNFKGTGNQVDIEGDSDFFIHSDIATPLAAGSSETFTITFTPQAVGLRQASVTLHTDDPNTPTFTFDIQGTGLVTTNSGDGLQVATTTPGSGASAVTGSDLTIDYTGYLMDGEQFDSSIGGTPLDVVLGRGSVIQGWEEGLIGIQPGESRVLIIPGALAYPDGNDNGSVAIPADAPLLFTVTADSVTQPAITIQGNSTNSAMLTNGESSPDVNDFTDFGVASTTVSTNGSITRTFTISNTTSADLTISGIPTFSGADAGDFSVTSAPAATVDAGSSSNFTITFAPQDVGLRRATVEVDSSDPNQPAFTFDIQGTGLTTVNSTTGLMIATTATGSGLAAVQGSTVSVNFTGQLDTGPVFASETDPNSPGDVVIGNPGSIAGLSEGLIGIEPGETRTLFIPASLAFGFAGFGDIPADAPLVYTVTAVAVAAPVVNITVSANESVIANGDTTPNILDFTDFGYMSTTPNASIGNITHLYDRGRWRA